MNPKKVVQKKQIKEANKKKQNRSKRNLRSLLNDVDYNDEIDR